MAPPLKRFFDAALVARIAAQLERVEPAFPRERFVAEATHRLGALELMDRARLISAALRRALPADFDRAAAVLVASLGPERDGTARPSMEPFLYLPHVLLVADHGLDHFEASMRAQYELTKRFTAEFSIRRFLERHPAATLARLERWTADANPHVRRLVSEGARPRLPWAPRLRGFQRDPTPVLGLLERLKDNPHAYVRRSVANCLNDIGKDHPAVLVEVCRRWSAGATPQRAWIVRHALRWAVKRGDAGALAVLGYRSSAGVRLTGSVRPRRVEPGAFVEVRLEVVNGSAQRRKLAVDVAVHFVKATGPARAKVFKGASLALGPGGHAVVEKRVSLAAMSTRVHRPGLHRVDALLNGRAIPVGAFVLADRPRRAR